MSFFFQEMEWSEDLVLQLIEAYRERPVLWDVGHKLFKIKTKRNDVWEELATIFNTDRYEVKKKINSLLASFRRERRKVMCTTSGIGADEVSQSKWFAFKSLLFLMDKNKLRQSQCTDEVSSYMYVLKVENINL
jgi:Alcohol dehydrogenase transcription factor Myb/SANT-like.